MSWVEAEKSSLSSSLPYFPLSSMHKVVGKAILPKKSFSKTAQFYMKSCSSRYFTKQNSFTSKTELCQTRPYRVHQCI
jgi:hypothetical protein